MSVSETKRLLREHRIVSNKLLGQNFLVEPSIFPKLSDYASLGKMVVAVEKDPRVAAVLREQLKGLANVTVIEGDVLKVAVPGFSKVVSVPPYYVSSRLVTWLFDRGFECAVLILQREFADRLVAAVGSDVYGWLTVVTCHSAVVELLDPIPKSMFYPPPEVNP